MPVAAEARWVRGVQHIRADLGEGRQPPDGVVEIRAALDEVVGTAGDDDPSVGRLDRAPDACDGFVEVADRSFRIARGVLDTDTRQAVLDSGLNRCRDIRGRCAVPVLEVAVDRQPGEAAEQPCMFQMLGAGDFMAPVRPAQYGGERNRRRPDRLETGVGQHQRREPVPGVRQDEAAVAGVQRHELLVELGAHRVS